jgi:hypothetical protein
MNRCVVLAVLVTTTLLASCATGEPAMKWEPRKDADVKADMADCTHQADALDYHSPETFSDARYGAAVAFAARTNVTDITSSSLDRMHDAVTYVCMTDKGWKPAS